MLLFMLLFFFGMCLVIIMLWGLVFLVVLFFMRKGVVENKVLYCIIFMVCINVDSIVIIKKKNY